MIQADKTYLEEFFKLAFGSHETEQLFCVQKTGGQMRELRGTPGGLFPTLKSYNEQGYNIYFTVNRVDGLKRKARDVIDVRALFTDADGVVPDLGNLSIQPNIEVISKNGSHHYFIPRTPPPKEYFKPLQKRLAKALGTDPAVNDLPRLMRCPGFFHVKDPNDPFFVEYRALSGTRYSFEEILEALPEESDPDPGMTQAKKKKKARTK